MFKRAALATIALAGALGAQGKVTTPKEFFGHNIGDDYWLPTYDQFEQYWHKIDGESNRMKVIEIGKSGEGRPQLAAIITAPENFAKLERYRQISKQLQAAEGVTEAQARALAKEGKWVVWIDGESNRMKVIEIGKSGEGRPQLAAIITAPENFAKLE